MNAPSWIWLKNWCEIKIDKEEVVVILVLDNRPTECTKFNSSAVNKRKKTYTFIVTISVVYGLFSFEF